MALSKSKRADLIITFEMGEIDEKSIITLFQDLIDTGLAWSLQGTYGRTATALIEAGYCRARKEIKR